MAQPAASPTPNVLKPPLASPLPPHLAKSLFYPRKEFLPHEPRVPSSFSLLTLAGQGFVRLYGFPTSIINGLRRLFDDRLLTLDVRENVTNHFFEFSLDKKPWTNIKSLTSERLIVAIFSVIFQHGFSFLSTIDYAREHDDRVAIAFSRPSTAPVNSSLPVVPNPNASASTLAHPGPMLFAISFPSNSLLRVIDPPLPLTPGILQAVRSAWPRGVASEKKLGDSHEFKLNGYKWFQENTFSVDSLQQTLSLLNNLDRHSFTLLTSLTLGSRSRTRDFWVFKGPPEESDSPPASPTGSTFTMKRDVAPYKCSPLKQVTPSNSSGGNSKLRKPWPKAELPRAFQSVSSFNDQSLNGHGKLPSEVGSVDMTGVGAHRQPTTETPASDVFYPTRPAKPADPYQPEFNPWNRALSPPPPHVGPPRPSQSLTVPSSWGRQHSRHHSMSSTDDPILCGIQESPYDVARQSSSSNDSKLRRPSSPPSVGYPPQPLQFTPMAESGPPPRHSADSPRPRFTNVDSDPPRIPTPPLLGTQAFRDSGLTTVTGWRSTEVPIIWTGKDPEPTSTDDAPLVRPLSSASRSVPHGPRERRPSSMGRAEHLQVPHPPLERPGSSGPVIPGAWASMPKEEQPSNDVVVAPGTTGTSTPPLRATNSSQSNANSAMIPPTIREQPSKEGDEFTEKRGHVQARSPEHHHAQGEGARKSEAAVIVGNTNAADRDRYGRTSTQATAHGHANGNGHPMNTQRPPYARRGASISEGWVLVNVDGRRKSKTSSSPSRSSGQGSSQAVLLRHQRSQSDSRVPAAMARGSPANATMSAAAKAIVPADAMGQAREKQQSGGKLRRLLGRSSLKDKDKERASDGQNPEASTSSQQSTRAPRLKQTEPTQTTRPRKCGKIE